MPRFGLRDFFPPILTRAFHHLAGRKSPHADTIHPKRVHPFDALPVKLEAECVLDIGANKGETAIAALNSYPDACVICFEPVKRTYQELSQRLAPFSERTQLFECALSDKTGEGEINITTFHGANSLMQQSKYYKRFNPQIREIGKERIRLVRLDDISSEFKKRRVDIMKIDVEGYENNVIKGGYNFISENVDVIIIEIALMRDNSIEDQAVFEIFALLGNAGFRLINVMDLNTVPDEDLMLAQMDCVFRHKSKLG